MIVRTKAIYFHVVHLELQNELVYRNTNTFVVDSLHYGEENNVYE